MIVPPPPGTRQATRLRPASPSFATNTFRRECSTVSCAERAGVAFRLQFEVVDDGVDDHPRELVFDERSG